MKDKPPRKKSLFLVKRRETTFSYLYFFSNCNFLFLSFLLLMYFPVKYKTTKMNKKNVNDNLRSHFSYCYLWINQNNKYFNHLHLHNGFSWFLGSFPSTEPHIISVQNSNQGKQFSSFILSQTVESLTSFMFQFLHPSPCSIAINLFDIAGSSHSHFIHKLFKKKKDEIIFYRFYLASY